jgi:hypothetical protein
VQGKLPAQGYRSIGVCGEAFGTHVRQQHESYARIIKDANIKAD